MNESPKSIGIFYPSLENLGGIERVIEALARIFSFRDKKVQIITEHPVVILKPSLARFVEFFVIDKRENAYDFESLNRFLEEKKTDLFIIHGAHYDSAPIIAAHLNNRRIKIILNVHFSFPTPLYLTGDEELFQKHLQVARYCDTVATVSEIDTVFWNALGISAVHVQNPINIRANSKQQSQCSQPPRRNLLWIGRMMEPKQPEEALFILREILKYLPDVKLTMLGGTVACGKKILCMAKELGVNNNVCISPEITNIEDYYSISDMHLLTSCTESFCLVLAEAKSCGIPTAMYEIPFLELVGDGRGIITAPYKHRVELAKKIVEVLTNEEAWIQLSKEASESLKSFHDNKVYETWIQAFNSDSSISTNSRQINTICEEFYKAWTYRIQKDLWKINLWNDFEKLVGNSAASMLSRLLNLFFRNLRKAKQYLSR